MHKMLLILSLLLLTVSCVSVEKNNNEIEVIGQGRFLRLLSKGGWEYTERVNASGVVGIIAVTESGHIVLTKQFRPPVNKEVIDMPAGLIGDLSDNRRESIVDAARRELFEETGYKARQMRYITQGPSSAGMSNEIVSYFIATDVKKVVAEGGVGDERITILEIPVYDAYGYLKKAVKQEDVFVNTSVYAALYLANIACLDQ